MTIIIRTIQHKNSKFPKKIMTTQPEPNTKAKYSNIDQLAVKPQVPTEKH